MPFDADEPQRRPPEDLLSNLSIARLRRRRSLSRFHKFAMRPDETRRVVRPAAFQYAPLPTTNSVRAMISKSSQIDQLSI